ncbi:MAG: F0F1 ATP synthase subunit alpha [Patescibacteria group bacterium]
MTDIQSEIGYVTSCEDYLFYLEGLPGARINDLLVADDGSRALVAALAGNRVQALMLDAARPKPGAPFHLSSDGIKIPLGHYLFGRTISPLGRPIDGRTGLPLDGPVLNLDITAPGIGKREMISEPLITGFTVVDTLIPIGLGQRELIFGDARSGKTSFLLDTIIAQKEQNIVCIYAAIGKPEIDTKRFANVIEQTGASAYTIIIAATSSQPAPLIAIAPATAFFVAEYFLHQGQDVLLILDDLGIHAKYLREIALLAKQIPGRESYPGGIFYEHSHLMERAGRFIPELGGASITLLPVIETELENMTNLIPTNLMSQTDGHILFSAGLRSQGWYPGIEWDRSVTRVGRQTQSLMQKLLSTKIRTLLSEYKELQGFIKFETELTAVTQTKIKQAQMAEEILRQDSQQAIPAAVQLILFALIFTTFLEPKETEFVRTNKRKLINAIARTSALTGLAVDPGLNDLESFLAKVDEQTGVLEEACK